MNKVVYTVIIGDYKLYEPKVDNPNWDHVCFTDNVNMKSDSWDIRIVENEDNLSDRKLSRKPKILNDYFLKDCDLSIYIDSKFSISCDLDKFVSRQSKDHNITMMSHPSRTCLYDEAEYCLKKGIGEKENIKKQIARDKKAGMPRQQGLTAGGIIIRKHGIENQTRFMEKWFQELVDGSDRDQIGFPYVLWKNELDLFHMPFKKTYKRFRR